MVTSAMMENPLMASPRVHWWSWLGVNGLVAFPIRALAISAQADVFRLGAMGR
jgi:hypothetical protein